MVAARAAAAAARAGDRRSVEESLALGRAEDRRVVVADAVRAAAHYALLDDIATGELAESGLVHRVLRCAERWKRLDLGARAIPRNPKFVERLEIQPELRSVPEEVSEPQGSIAGDRALPLDDRGDPIRRHGQPAREFRSTHVERLQLLGQVFPGMYRCACHCVLLVIVHDLNVAGPGRALTPLKAHAPLIVDPDTVLTLSNSLEGLEPVAG